jgi:hypothetical protein
VLHFGAIPAWIIIQPSAIARRAVAVQQRSMTQPVDQRLPVRGEQDALQVRVDLALVVRTAFGDRQQRQVVVAQHHVAVLAQRMHQAQRFQRFAAAVDQVAAEPQPVLRGVEADLLQQALGGTVAALEVADRPDRHQCSILGMQRTNCGISASNSVPSSARMT